MTRTAVRVESGSSARLRLHLVTTLDGLPIAFALTNPKPDEREVLMDLFDLDHTGRDRAGPATPAGPQVVRLRRR
jgi:hypothetical protein